VRRLEHLWLMLHAFFSILVESTRRDIESFR
jgi:hypothetical protein